MHELTRRAYLDAMGISTYVSRGVAPGAAPTQKLVILESELPSPSETVAKSAANEMRRVPKPSASDSPAPASVNTLSTPAAATAQSAVAAEKAFGVIALQTGKWLWLEELAAGSALRQDQVQLVSAMAHALGWGGGKPGIYQFKWPIHNNKQLDLGQDAARSSAGGFVSRLMDESRAVGVVLLGGAVEQRLPGSAFSQCSKICIASTHEMLAAPGLKKQVWSELRPFAS